jgi:hypothetical protein
MKTGFLFALWALVLAPFSRAGDPAALGFIRTTTEEKQNTVQTLSQEYRPASGVGPSIWLVGVAHLGSAEYFKAIQARLDRQTVVLFEGVNGEAMKEGLGAATKEQGVQEKLATALGLKFQLDAIDYRRPSFFNSDVTMGDLKKQVNSHGRAQLPPAKSANGKKEPAAEKEPSAEADTAPDNETFKMLMEAMEGTGAMGKMVDQFIAMVNSSPQMRETTKVMLIEVLGQAGGLLEKVKAASPDMKSMLDVLVTERNDAVVRDLRERLTKLRPTDSIAIFYGAVHLDEIAARLGSEFHYAPVKQEWDTAFSADPTKSAFPPGQIRMILDLMLAQMKQKAGGAPPPPEAQSR